MYLNYICFSLLSVVVFGVLGNQCIRMAEPTVLPENKGKQLINHLLDSSATHSLSACGEKCLLRRKCKSVNFDVELRVCELNTASRLTAPVSDVIDAVTSFHYTSDQFSQAILGKCANHDCNEGSICRQNPAGSTTRYICIEDSQPRSNIEPICNGTTNVDGGPVTLTSPDINGDGYYDNFTDCVWTFEVSSGHIKITTQAFELEPEDMGICYFDWLKILDGLTEHGPYCGTTIVQEYTSASQELGVAFHTDSSVVTTGRCVYMSCTFLTNGGCESVTAVNSCASTQLYLCSIGILLLCSAISATRRVPDVCRCIRRSSSHLS